MSDNKPVVRMDAPAPEGFEGEGFCYKTEQRNRFGQKLFFVAFAICNFMLWYRIYGIP
jgi:hypothetical protein